MSIIIRPAKASDAEALLAFLKQVGSETDNLTFGKEGLPFSVEDESAFLTQLEASQDDCMLIATDCDEIVGNASLNRQPRRMNHRGDFSVAILKSHWNRGIGKLLLESILSFAKENNFEVIDLQVRSDNLSAIHLYEKFGFKKFGTHPAFYKIDGKHIPVDYMSLTL